jgi:hypothetical protein
MQEQRPEVEFEIERVVDKLIEIELDNRTLFLFNKPRKKKKLFIVVTLGTKNTSALISTSGQARNLSLRSPRSLRNPRRSLGPPRVRIGAPWTC